MSSPLAHHTPNTSVPKGAGKLFLLFVFRDGCRHHDLSILLFFFYFAHVQFLFALQNASLSTLIALRRIGRCWSFQWKTWMGSLLAPNSLGTTSCTRSTSATSRTIEMLSFTRAEFLRTTLCCSGFQLFLTRSSTTARNGRCLSLLWAEQGSSRVEVSSLRFSHKSHAVVEGHLRGCEGGWRAWVGNHSILIQPLKHQGPRLGTLGCLESCSNRPQDPQAWKDWAEIQTKQSCIAFTCTHRSARGERTRWWYEKWSNFWADGFVYHLFIKLYD